MKKLSLLIALCMLLTIGGVYATWTYTQNTDVADEAVNMNMNLTDVAYSGSYGTYKVDTSSLKLAIDPKTGTTHTTALYIEGNIVITFTPNSVAPVEIKENGLDTTYTFSLSNPTWQYNSQNIVTLNHAEAHSIEWVKQADGTFTYTISAAALSSHISLTEIVLDTKTAYDAYNAVLGKGAIVITVSDGVTASN